MRKLAACAGTVGCNWQHSVLIPTRSTCCTGRDSSPTRSNRGNCRKWPRPPTGTADYATTWALPKLFRQVRMLDKDFLINALGIAPLVVPILLVAVMGLASLLGRPLTEAATSRLVQLATVLGLFAAI